MKNTVKVKCKCTGPAADFQDKQYGKDMRIANVTQKGEPQSRDVRCTVCGTTHKANLNKD